MWLFLAAYGSLFFVCILTVQCVEELPLLIRVIKCFDHKHIRCWICLSAPMLVNKWAINNNNTWRVPLNLTSAYLVTFRVSSYTESIYYRLVHTLRLAAKINKSNGMYQRTRSYAFQFQRQSSNYVLVACIIWCACVCLSTYHIEYIGCNKTIYKIISRS